jgi:putative transposase
VAGSVQASGVEAEGVSLVGPGGLLAGLTKTVLETAVEVEMSDRLGYEAQDRPGITAGSLATGPGPRRS